MSGFFAKYNNNSPFFDKRELAHEGTIFSVDEVLYETGGRYGAQWVLIATVEDTGAKGRIGLPAAPYRDDMMRDLRDATASKPVRAKLRSYYTKSGNTGYDLTDPDADDSPDEDAPF